jgi:HPt (histidine-containing phosphotransfer) domain-containing protein
MDTHLAKPVSKDTLLAQVAQSVRQGRSLRTALTRSAHASANEITIDPVVFDELRALGEASGQDFVSSLVEQFAEDTEPLLVQLRRAVEAGDARAVGRIAHSIKGSCGQLGGRRLASSCGRLEANAATGSLSDGKRDLQDIEIGYQALRGAWAAQLDSDDEGRMLHA